MAFLPFEPQYSTQSTAKPKVLKANYGDGYEQRQAVGINNIQYGWSMEWTLKKPDRDALISFFVSLNGITAFDWKPWIPDATTEKYVVESWTETKLDYDIYNITANIYRVYE